MITANLGETTAAEGQIGRILYFSLLAGNLGWRLVRDTLRRPPHNIINDLTGLLAEWRQLLGQNLHRTGASHFFLPRFGSRVYLAGCHLDFFVALHNSLDL